MKYNQKRILKRGLIVLGLMGLGLGAYLYWSPEVEPAHAQVSLMEAAESHCIEKAMDLSQGQKDIERLIAVKDSMLPIEWAEKHRLERRIAELQFAMKAPGYRKIDMSFLEWRNGVVKYKAYGDMLSTSIPKPRFAVFSSEHPRCVIDEDGHLPTLKGDGKALAPYFKDVIDVLKGVRWGSLSLRCYFEGGIPIETRNIINQAKDQFEEVLIVAETDEWDLEYDVRSRRGDPLVIGRIGEDFWLITYFDITDSEREAIDGQ